MDNTDVKRNVILTRPVSLQAKRHIAGGRVKSVGRVLLEKVRPFRFAMLLSLQRKGIATKRLPFKVIAALFFNYFCTNSFGIAPVDVSAFANNVAFRIKDISEAEPYNTNGRIHSEINQVMELAEYIVEQFRQSNEKYNVAKSYGYDPNFVITDEEILQAKAFKRVYRNLNNELKSDNFVKVSDLKGAIKLVVIIGIVYYILKQL